jgi:hypothetical protein
VPIQGQRCWPVCGELLLPGVVLPCVVVVLVWPPPGALAAFGPMPPAAEVELLVDVPAGVPVVPVCDGLFVSGAGLVPLPEVPLVLVLPVVLLVVEDVPVVLAASPPDVLAVGLLPSPVVFWSPRWQADKVATAAANAMARLDDVNLMG